MQTHLREVADTFQQKIAGKELDLVLDIANVDKSMVCGDPHSLREILVNLIDNAVKFTYSGEIVISAALSHPDSHRVRLDCAIADTGTGIDEVELKRLFNSPDGVDVPDDRQYGQNGDGLLTVKTLCEAMAGSVEVSSEVGRGSIFRFNVCFDSIDQEKLNVPLVDLARLSVLLVDDDEQNIQILRWQLEQWGVTLSIVCDGKAALGYLEQQCISGDGIVDAIIMAAQLPGMDGITLGKIIRSDERYRNLKLIMMTQQSARGDARQLADLGFDAYFPMPVLASDICNALSVVVAGGKVRERAKPLVTHHYLRDLHHSLEDQDIDQKPYRILVVKDNEINRQVVLGILEYIGFYADVVENGHEALAILVNPPDQKPYNLIIMDCQMPLMDGYEATRQIRSGQAGAINRDIPIVALTANALSIDRQKCLDAGMSDCLTKPVDSDALERVITRWLEDGKSQGDKNTSTGPVDRVWDKGSLLKRLRGKEDRVRKIVSIFIKDMPQQIHALQQAIDAENLVSSREIAHLIKGVASNLSGADLTEIAAEMQQACVDEELEQLKMLYPRLTAQYSRLESRLQEYSSGL